MYEHESVSRFRAIRQIERCFPPDAPAPMNAELGQKLLAEARRGFNDWRLEPTVVLVRLAKLNREAARAMPPLRRK
jgi:hypothetical protein